MDNEIFCGAERDGRKCVRRKGHPVHVGHYDGGWFAWADGKASVRVSKKHHGAKARQEKKSGSPAAPEVAEDEGETARQT